MNRIDGDGLFDEGATDGCGCMGIMDGTFDGSFDVVGSDEDDVLVGESFDEVIPNKLLEKRICNQREN